MDLNKRIENQNKLIEDINDEIDNLLNEGGIDIVKDIGAFVTGGWLGLARKKGVDAAIDAGKDELKKKQKDLKKIEKDDSNTKEVEAGIKELKADIAEIRKQIKALKSGGSSIYKRIEIFFKDEIKLGIEKYGTQNFDRTLKGRMYFNILSINEKSKYIEMTTKSFPKGFKIRLTYQYLEIGKKQKGKARLVRKKGTENLLGDMESVRFEIKSLK